MVLVDVYVPAMDKSYNFSLNEKVNIRTIIDEIVEMIEQKERMEFRGKQERLNLYYGLTKNVLPRENSLTDCYVTNGARLILI